MNERPKLRWGCLQWGIVVGVIVLLVSMLIPSPPFRSGIQTLGMQTRAINNCKQIILSLRQYAIDNGALYPDGSRPELNSANQIFRELFKEEIVLDERIFGCPASKFNPDNEMGWRSNFEKTLLPDECHWMLLKRQTENSHPKTPIVLENSLVTSWPPKWEYQRWFGKTLHKRGRSWRGREIIIGRNDGSVTVEKLRPDGTLDWHSAPNLDEHGKSWIDYLTPEQIANLSYWDIEEK